MKACPCCNSLTFDDMDTCFVCMHKFAMSEAETKSANKDLSNAVALSSLGDIVDGTIDRLVELPKSNTDSKDTEGSLTYAKEKSNIDSTDISNEEDLGFVSSGEKPDIQDLSCQYMDKVADELLLENNEDTDVSSNKSEEYINKTSWNYTDTLCADVVVESKTSSKVNKSMSWNLDIELAGFPEYKCKLSNNGQRLTIGRATNNDIIVPDLKVSRKHAEMFVSQDKLWIVDCGSKNMTILDGIPVMGTREISSNATIKIGSAKIGIMPE